MQKSPYSKGEYSKYLQSLYDICEQENFKLLIKPHPKEPDAYSGTEYQGNKDIVRRLELDIGLSETFIVSEIAIGLCSSALIEYKQYGQPAISYDTLGWGESIGMSALHFTALAASAQELGEVLRSSYDRSK